MLDVPKGWRVYLFRTSSETFRSTFHVARAPAVTLGSPHVSVTSFQPSIVNRPHKHRHGLCLVALPPPPSRKWAQSRAFWYPSRLEIPKIITITSKVPHNPHAALKRSGSGLSSASPFIDPQIQHSPMILYWPFSNRSEDQQHMATQKHGDYITSPCRPGSQPNAPIPRHKEQSPQAHVIDRTADPQILLVAENLGHVLRSCE